VVLRGGGRGGRGRERELALAWRAIKKLYRSYICTVVRGYWAVCGPGFLLLPAFSSFPFSSSRKHAYPYFLAGCGAASTRLMYV
jgi:hypothetical protein